MLLKKQKNKRQKNWIKSRYSMNDLFFWDLGKQDVFRFHFMISSSEIFLFFFALRSFCVEKFWLGLLARLMNISSPREEILFVWQISPQWSSLKNSLSENGSKFTMVFFKNKS
mmetsp:Transcript_25128/g.34712  ORF Transcript_25128/g.34712 Transcript_25128/m.34712 type:complete len:113 (+) Transcript_25128:514-852(+)